MLINQARQHQKAMQVGFLVSLWHLGFSADFLYFAFFDGYGSSQRFVLFL